MTDQAKTTVSDERLAEMLAGLKGVTSGPWRAYRHPAHKGQIQIGAGEAGGGGDGWDDWCVAATFEASEPGELDAEHIARCDPDTMRSILTELSARRATADVTEAQKFRLGDRVTKSKGSSWTGPVVGFYSTKLTPVGYAVESENEPGSVQIYPEAALQQAPE